MAKRNSPQSPPMPEQVLTNPRLGIGIPVPEHLPEQKMTPSPVAPTQNNDIFLGLIYRVNAEFLNDWATVTQLMKENIGFVVQEPDVTEDFKPFLIIMYGSNGKKGFWLIKP